jgi:cob(I)alamin adenosyltransferase
VSGATYRIDVEHRPDPTSTVQWIARVTRLSDDNQVTALWGQSAEAAVTAARAVAVRAEREAVGADAVRGR